MPFQPTPEELHAISAALNIAAGEYTRCKQLCESKKETRLAEQFQRQRDAALALVERIENADCGT